MPSPATPLTPPAAAGAAAPLRLLRLSVFNFKNIGEATLDFSPNVNCLVGDNGMGKTNLLDAIHYLSFCRSFSGMTDRMLVRRGEEFLTARGEYLRRGVDETIALGITTAGRKTLKRGAKDYKRLTEHIGLLPLVMSSPGDTDLVRGPGEERRRWLDMVVSQSDPAYLEALSRYQTALTQRNSLLRAHVVDHALYDAVEAVMAMAAETLMARRARFVDTLRGLFEGYHGAVSGPGGGLPGMAYAPSVAQGADFRAALDGARRRDEAVGHTTVGPHRDDIDFSLDEMPLRRAGSQGQCKTYAVALRLAQFDFLRTATGVTPLLLLDDIFDKLDAGRVERIVDLVASDSFGQIFITDTNRTHLDHILDRLEPADRRLWRVEQGRFTPAQ